MIIIGIWLFVVGLRHTCSYELQSGLLFSGKKLVALHKEHGGAV